MDWYNLNSDYFDPTTCEPKTRQMKYEEAVNTIIFALIGIFFLIIIIRHKNLKPYEMLKWIHI